MSATRTPPWPRLLFAELAATVKDRKQTVIEYLDDLYIDVGHYGEGLINKTYKGREGVETIQALMHAFRDRPAPPIAGLDVTEVLITRLTRFASSVPSRPARPCPSRRAIC